MKVLPIYIDAGISGFESPAAEYKELGLSLDELLIQHPNATFIGQASGDSMIEAGIFDGDLLIVDRSLTANNGNVIVANYNGNFVCKIIDKYQARLLSASKEHCPVKIKEGDVFQVEGVVTASLRFHNKVPELANCTR
ncbi:DNA polymerase V [Colwellia chukchiensis]|uniref:DNA polymerase V n=1 Tax=Colwellia chukchiensis TaxID=641665 RepID=A0A1H7U290_9GAMM|nr:translesion error-prone DNA polymerase V autoproteolytic subunit [Colwellia chukchiensis]SEL90367.1 DNA polymerase V [Colwellia chukchiensis]